LWRARHRSRQVFHQARQSYSLVIEDSDRERLVAVLSAYEVGEELGRGTCGVVLQGRHRQLGRLVAIKQLPPTIAADPGVRTRFISEARLLATLDHSHVVRIYDFVDQDGLCLLVMERLTGGSVRSRFQAGGFTVDASCALLIALCSALHHAHERGILHRDIKPENLMFSAEGILKVTDFGIAKVIGGSATLATRAGEIMGTPAYIAPEQAQGAELSPATDVYGAGTLLYELLAGRLPFPNDGNPATVLYRHVYEHPVPLQEVAPAVPGGLAVLTARALASSPSERYASAEEFGVAIADFAARTWGPGWLALTKIPVSAGGPIVSTALGEAPPASVPISTSTTQVSPGVDDPSLVPADLVPVQLMHPELGGSGDDPGSVADKEPSGDDPAERGDELARGAHASAQVGAAVTEDTKRGSSPRWSKRIATGALAALVLVGGVTVALVFLHNRGHHPQTGRHGTITPPAIGSGTLNSASWRALRSAPTARQQAAGAVANGTLWVFGGLTTGASTAKVEGYDPVIDTWETGPDLPLALHHDMATTYKGELVVMGGWIPYGSILDAIASDRVFALRGAGWVELPKLNHPRAAGGAATVGDKIIVVGGQAGGQLVTPTEVFDGNQWKDVAPIPTPRDHLAVVSDGRYLYAVGGRMLSADKNLGAVERYDPATNQWTKLPDLPTPRGGLGAAIVGTRLIAVGGESPTSVFDTVEALDLSTNTWSTLAPMRTPRHGMAILAVGNTLYAIDGAATPGHTGSVPTTEALDLSSSTVAPQS
jgi:serine/threonine protein kinase/N-acetylneuraminic acid mutarotase